MNEIERAIKTLQGECGCVELDLANGKAYGEKAQEFIDACHVALEALREKQERDTEAKRMRTEQKPQPLTIEELHEFIDSDEEDNAIWVKNMKHDYFTRALLDWDRDRGIFAIWHGDKDTSDFPIEKDYGKTWLAYRTKPERSGEWADQK